MCLFSPICSHGDDVADFFRDKVIEPLAPAVGLGKLPNCIPADTPRNDCAPRTVILGWHPVAGLGGQIFEHINPVLSSLQVVSDLTGAPNPTHHWAVHVGEFVHELNADSKLRVVYQNLRVSGGTFLWKTRVIGTTRFNDEAIRLAGMILQLTECPCRLHFLPQARRQFRE